MTEIEYIELILENCEDIRIPRDYIGSFHISNIQKHISRNAVNSISDSLSCEGVFLQISSKANQLVSYSTTWNGNSTLPFSRLQQAEDITAVKVHYKNGTEDYIFVNWKGDLDYKNEIQTSVLHPQTGDFYLAISEKETADIYFSEYLASEENPFWKFYK